MPETKFAIFGGIFLGLGVVLLFILFFWILTRARYAQDESEKRGYGALIRFAIFFFSILFIFFAYLFFQMQNYLRPFQILSSEKFIGEIKAEPAGGSYLNLFFYSVDKKGRTYEETFEILENKKLRIEAEVLNWDNSLSFFGFRDGYKLTRLEEFSDTLQQDLKAYTLSGGPTEIWDKIYQWKKVLFFVKPEKLESD
ncbi:MAG: hypothetical protein MUO78_05550, partial [candidate division Zixibacteria bacterium]|nr:hypothetical protein [candidate division Zixibacteria bacterium]